MMKRLLVKLLANLLVLLADDSNEELLTRHEMWRYKRLWIHENVGYCCSFSFSMPPAISMSERLRLIKDWFLLQAALMPRWA